ncbi:phosphoribosylanthranilate isomerase [Legionella impletisoli]|nr:phosphoribosylanthranilate isomerase [Legionella impletisoli]
MTQRQDIELAVSLGVDAVGLIFYSQSARCITLSNAKQLSKNLPPFMSLVAVFVNPERQFVEEVIRDIPVHILQFHGDESSEFCEQFSKPYIKAISATSYESILQEANKYPNASGILLDTPSSQRGGSGQTFDWAMIPQQLPLPIILAGGINTQNVMAAISSLPLYAIDVCSGVESSPGIKDHQKMKQFMQTME